MRKEEKFSGKIISIFPKGSGLELRVLLNKENKEELKLYNRKRDDKMERGLFISGFYDPLSKEIIEYTLTED